MRGRFHRSGGVGGTVSVLLQFLHSTYEYQNSGLAYAGYCRCFEFPFYVVYYKTKAASCKGEVIDKC